MMDLAPLLEARRRRPDEKTAMVTIVEVKGSAFRRPGARMLVFEDGSWQGAVSSGCLESDLAERARRVIASGRPELADYQLGDVE
ncbi:MAG: XdhC family protein, partial [bacterium]